MPEDTPQGEEQRTMLTFAEAAERLVEDQIAQSMTAEGLRRLARDPLSGWPIGPSDYRMAGKVRMLPYELLAPYMRERLSKRRGRGPDTKKRSPKPKQQGDPVTTTVDARQALYAFVMQGKENSPAISDRASEKIDAFRTAVLREAAAKLDMLTQETAGADMTMPEGRWQAGLDAGIRELRRLADENQQEADV